MSDNQSKKSTTASSASELAEFREIFALVDRDMGGTITRNELGELMTLLSISVSENEMEFLFNEVDKDGDGHLDFNGMFTQHSGLFTLCFSPLLGTASLEVVRACPQSNIFFALLCIS
jgi:Ca2+-binding EF-hand superfamily protein